MFLAAKSDVGQKRENNQDSYSIGELTPGVCYAIVCDGMGGAAEGALASNECARIVRERIQAGYYEGMSDISVKSLLFTAVEYANKYIYSLSLSSEKYEGMGTTVVVSIVTSEFAYVAHAGDSRAYLVNPERHDIVQLTRDHSVVQRMVEEGRITAEEAAVHPDKHVITRAVGVDTSIRTDFCQEDVVPGDIILLCTDGLSNYVPVNEIVLSAAGVPLEDYIQKLVTKANENGGGDNITVAAIEV